MKNKKNVRYDDLSFNMKQLEIEKENEFLDEYATPFYKGPSKKEKRTVSENEVRMEI